MPAKLTLQSFIDKSSVIHNNKYTYSKAVYVNSHTDLIVTCPVHGDFNIRPNNHLSGKAGCPTCSKERTDPRQKTTADFISEATAVHKNLFDYSKVVYKGAHNPITVTHNTCGREWVTTPSILLRCKTCYSCSVEAMVETKRLQNETKKQNFVNAISSKYTLLTPYISAKDKVQVQHTCGHIFSSTPDNLLRKNHCPGCAKYGFKPNKPAILYYLEINNGQAYKLGITNNTVAERYLAKELKTIKVLYTWSFKSGHECRQLETLLLNKHKEYKYTGLPLLSSGNSELFTHNIINLQDIPYEHDRTN